MTRRLALRHGPTLGRTFALSLALALAFGSMPSRTRAATPGPIDAVASGAPSARGAVPATDAARSEARARFDRGLALFEKEHDAPAALEATID